MSARDRDGSSEYMRGALASVGILLDDKPAVLAADATVKASAEPLNRGEIRRILVARGAPQKHLRWLTISCPSYEDARAYEPPPETP